MPKGPGQAAWLTPIPAWFLHGKLPSICLSQGLPHLKCLGLGAEPRKLTPFSFRCEGSWPCEALSHKLGLGNTEHSRCDVTS